MMATTGAQYGFIALWGLHILSVIAFFTGVLFLIVLAIKTFDAAQLRQWAIWLMVIGTILCLFTIAVLGRPWLGVMGYWGAGMEGMRMMQMDRMMDMMEEHNADRNDPAHAELEDMMRMMSSPRP